jgi:hypothetical protein
MARKRILMETAFWDYFSECSRRLLSSINDGIHPADTFDLISRWNSMFQFICRSNVYIDSPLNVLNEKAKTDPMLYRLLEYNGDGCFDLEYQGEPFPVLESDNKFENDDDYSSLFLSKEDHHKTAREHGVINICAKNIWDQQDKFKDTGSAIKKDRGFAWYSLDILRENSNGMVIIDNYVLPPEGDCYLKFDLKILLELMLPDHCNEEYVLSIFYLDKNKDVDLIEDRRKKLSQLIQKHVFQKAKKRKLILKVELFPTSEDNRHLKEFHDRTIITNNVWIGSEAGFDLLIRDNTTNTNTRAKKTTNTHALYLGFGNDAAHWLDNAYDNLIEDAKKCLEKYKYKTKNRLLL